MPGQGQGNQGNNGNNGNQGQGQGNQGQGQGNQGQGNQGQGGQGQGNQGNNGNQSKGPKKWEPVGVAQQSAEEKKILIRKIKRINTGFDNYTETISKKKEKEVLQQLNISKIRSNESKKN